MNAPANITRAALDTVDAGSWSERYYQAKGTERENAVLIQLAAEMDAADEPLWAACYDAATIDFNREEFIKDIEETFATWEAEEAHDAACYAFEVRNGQPWDASPVLWDRDAWIAREAGRAQA